MACPFCKQEHSHTFDQALEMLDHGPQQVTHALAGASDAEISFREPKPGGWSPLQIASHLLDCELVYGVRYRKIIAEENAALPAFDEKAWGENLMGGRNLPDVVAAFTVLRKQNMDLVRASGASAHTRAGNHPEYGRLTVSDHILHIAEHDRKHAAQITRVREAYKRQ